MQPGMLTPAQLRAARALLGWSRDDLAVKSRTALETVQGFESRGADSRSSTLLKWQRALEVAGVEFIYAADGKGPGVRLKRDDRGKR
jgi:ribosome-binding protein aMBF1 (putative translation factor)